MSPALLAGLLGGKAHDAYKDSSVVAVVLPLAYVLVAVGAGEAFGLASGVSLLLLGLPVAAVLATILWRRLPAN